MTRRRAYGSGSIEQRGDSFSARVRVGGERKRLAPEPSIEAANTKAARAMKIAWQEGVVSPDGPTLRAFGEQFLADREKDGRYRNVPQDRSRWNTHVLTARFIDTPLRSITHVHVRAFAVGLLRKNAVAPIRTQAGIVRRETSRRVKHQTVRNVVSLLGSCFRAAIDAGLIDRNPAHHVDLGPEDVTDEPRTVLTSDEIERVRSSPALPDRERSIFVILLYTMMRPQELWGLHGNDVHLDGDAPHVVVRFSGTRATKGRRPRRVPLLDPARDAFARWFVRTPKARTGLVFPNGSGGVRPRGDDAGWADKPQRTKRGDLHVAPGMEDPDRDHAARRAVRPARDRSVVPPQRSMGKAVEPRCAPTRARPQVDRDHEGVRADARRDAPRARSRDRTRCPQIGPKRRERQRRGGRKRRGFRGAISGIWHTHDARPCRLPATEAAGA